MGQLLPKRDCMRKCILLHKCKPTYAHLHSQYHHLPFHTIARFHVSKITNIHFTANQRELMINFGSEINIIAILSTKETCYPIATVVIISISQYTIILLQEKAAMNTTPSQLSNMYSVSRPLFTDHQLIYYPHSLQLSLSHLSFSSLSATHICFREGLEQLMCGTLYPTGSMTCLIFIICILIFTSPSFLLRIHFH